VVNFELPNVPEDYVHRIGRTGRAGEEGAAISLVSEDEMKLLKDIQRILKKEVPVLPLPSFERRAMPAASQDEPRRSPAPFRKPNTDARSRSDKADPTATRRRPRRRARQASGGSR
jgi:ATP-dependent RNA helicase RhlE